MAGIRWYDPAPGELAAIEAHAGLPPEYVDVLGKATDATPFRDGGLYDPASSVPADGAWVDAYWGDGLAWTWGMGPRVAPGEPMPVIYLERSGTGATISAQDAIGTKGIAKLVFDEISGPELNIVADETKTLPLVIISGGVLGGTLFFTVRADGDVEIAKPSAGLILTSPNGTQYRLTVDDAGVVSTAAL